VLPAPLLVVVIGDNLALQQKQLVNIPSNMLASITFPDVTKLFSRSIIWKQGIIMGLLASL
jgi:hypothetical protein